MTVSKSEAAAYFDEAVVVASKIGDENLDRWSAILDLADRAANSAQPVAETAYKLARCAELIYAYVDRDKHFDWEGTVTAIAGLCPTSSLTILSRWRDRGFGRAERLLPAVVHFLVERRSIDPKAALSLIGFRADWDEIRLLRSTLETCASKADKETALGFLFRYMRLDEQSASVWRNAKEVAVSHGLTLLDIDALITFSERKERSSQSRNGGYSDSAALVSGRQDERNWDAIFSGINLSSANDVSRAYGRFKAAEPPYYHDRFFEEAYKRVSIGKEAEFIRAISDTTEFDLYHLRSFLEQFPDAWRTRLAVKSALADTVKSFCRRYCMAITKRRYYEVLPFKTACALSGLAEGEIVDIVLSAIGEATEVVGAGRLFTLVGLLALKLSHTEALEALSFGLDLFEGILEESDGDGPWSGFLAPPAETNAAIAGYIWAGLAAPKASLRWAAAHAVRGLCTLDRKEVLTHLINLAKAAKGGPFVDARLHFYHLHALQWLLIALARVANENPAAIAPYADFLMHCALRAEPHVLIRTFAAKALLSLANSGSINPEPSVIDGLKAINTSKIPIVSSKRYDRHRHHVHPMHRESGSKRFSFDYDMGRYWFESLGDCFAITSSEIEEQAEKVIGDEWNLLENGHWDRDERARHGLFRDSISYHSHGSYPRVDDLNFYLSYHAMMTVAGRLLASVPLHQDPDDSEDEFAYWLSRHGLARDDGNWLADRRDPGLLDWPTWKDEKQEDDWRWSVSREDFERILGLSGNRLNLWGHWSLVSGSREESIHVGSALVSPERSVALLRALQTASNPHDYRIPDANDDLQIDSGEFLLKGWVVDRDHDSGLDKFDPWAGDIRYPPIIPAQFVRDLMKLDCDAENRVWRRQDDRTNESVLWSQIWGCYRDKDDETEGERGRRLQASFSFVTEFLETMSMDLIVEVEIKREVRRSRYENRREEGLGYVPPYAKLFVIKSDGRICAI